MVSASYNVKGLKRQPTGIWDKYLLLLWKNWKLFYRNKWGLFKDVLAPILFCSSLLIVRHIILVEDIPNDVVYNPIDPDNLDLVSILMPPYTNITWAIAYSPSAPNTDHFMDRISESLELPTESFKTEEDLLDFVQHGNNPFACVVFEDDIASSAALELPKKLNYEIRFPSLGRITEAYWNTDRIHRPISQSVLRSRNFSHAHSQYFLEGFSAVQNAISLKFIEHHNQINALIPKVIGHRYPFPATHMDYNIHLMRYLLSAILIISFVPPAMNITKSLAIEKEKQLKVIMKIMGMPDWLHWTAWFTKFFVNMLVIVSCIVAFLKIPFYHNYSASVMTFSNWTTIWVFLLAYTVSVIMFSFMVSAIIKSPSSASLLTGVIMLILYVPYFLIQNLDALPSMGQVMGMSIFNSMGMAFGFETIMKLEDRREGLQWSNLFTPLEFANGIQVGNILIMLIVSSIVYLIIALYFEKIMPGDYGIPEKWYFPVSKTFWCGEPKTTEDQIIENKASEISSESYPTDKKVGISIRNLRKVYSNGKIAVQRLGLNMFEDEITVLLGHNGAGKTTTISMLTGMIPATSGTALINSHDIRTQMDQVRGFIGICPQHNILFDELTVSEHIKFYSRLKGLRGEEIDEEVNKYLKTLHLENKRYAHSSTLSGGMKRRLCIGMALCGDSKFVLFDEPTAGMDPTARRALWDLLQQEKKGRTIILSTHFMDEADVLGDRIGIMHDGQLKCYGSSFFLKKEFGDGYTLTFEKGLNCNEDEISKVLEAYIPVVEMIDNVGTELSFKLPDYYSKSFEPMLSSIENRATELGIIGYGISVTTLEEVFLRLGSDNHHFDDARSESGSSILDSDVGSTITLNEPSDLLTGPSLGINQFLAMLMKNFFYSIRNWVISIIILLIPVIFVLLTIISARAFLQGNQMPPLDLTLNMYDFRTVNVLQRNFTDPSDFLQRIADSYLKIIPAMDSRHKTGQTDENLNSFFLRIGNNDFPEFTRHHVTSASISEELVMAWFSNQYFHTLPVSMQIAYNSILKAVAGSDYELNLRINPLPYGIYDELNISDNYADLGFQIMLNMGCGMVVGTALYIIFYIKERMTKAKLLQFVSGVNVWIFWLTTILCDAFKYLVSICLLLLALVAFQPSGWSSAEEMGRIFTLLICFGIATFPMIYLLAFINSDSANGFNNIAMIGFASLIIYILSLQLRLPVADMEGIADVLDWVLMIIPYYAFGHALYNMNTMNAMKSLCHMRCEAFPQCTQENICMIDECCNLDHFRWETPGIGRNITFMVALGIICLLILTLKELGYLKKIYYKIFTLKASSISELQTNNIALDSDVAQEKERIQNMSMTDIKQNNLVLKDMSKFYKKMLAVNSLSVGVGDFECFGLLGVNGAGKTTTFKMLTGDENISNGDAWIKGFSLKGRMKNIYPHIGYCPQFDAMLEDLTGMETMKIFCLLRGLPRSLIAQYTMRLAKELNFYQHIDKRIKEYSGGNKRKLSTALALIGDPSVIFLDEPTAGMDPGAKRNLWNVISRVRDSGKTIILTSHSMEECEALCTKITIMVNGEFKCLGSLQYLKNKFSKGFILTVQVSRSNSEEGEINLESIKAVHSYIIDNLPGSSLKEDYQGRMTYYIVNTNLKWSEMFGIMERAKETLNIENYSLTQTTLEQIFLDFAKYQKV